MEKEEILKVKKFPFSTYDVFLEIIEKTEDKKPNYFYRVYSQDHPIRDKSVQPYNQIVSKGFKEPWLAVIYGYNKVEVFPRKNKK